MSINLAGRKITFQSVFVDTEVGLLCELLEFCGFQDSIRSLSATSQRFYKSIHKHFYSVYHSVVDARPVEESGRIIDNILDICRFSVFKMELVSVSKEARSILSCINDIIKLRSSALLYKDLSSLNAGMYTNWDRRSSSLSHGVFKYLLNTVELNNLKETMRDRISKYVIHWKADRVTGEFFVLMDRPDGTVLLSSDFKRVYLALGIAQSIGAACDRAGPNSILRSPRGVKFGHRALCGHIIGSKVALTLLPWDQMIVYDGLMMFMERMSQQSIKRALRSYVRAVDSGTLISSLDRNHASPPLPSALTDLEEILGIHEDGTAVKSSAVPRTPTPSVGPPVPVSDRTKAHLASIRQAALIPNSASLMWVCRRLDYTEEENPNHIVMISDSTGRFVGSVFQCDHLIPTTAEYADLVAQGIQANQGRKPPAVFIDAIERVDSFSALMLEFDTGVNVMYYPPPSAEERRHSDMTNPYLRGKLCCAVCGVPKFLAASMMVCSRCKSAYYCSREHQKAHWRVHKRTCQQSQES